MLNFDTSPDTSWGTLWFGFNDMCERSPAAMLKISRTEMLCLACGHLVLIDESLIQHECHKLPVLWMDPSKPPPKVRHPYLVAQLVRAALGEVPQFPEQQALQVRIDDVEARLRMAVADADALRERLGEAVGKARAAEDQASGWQRRYETLVGQGM